MAIGMLNFVGTDAPAVGTDARRVRRRWAMDPPNPTRGVKCIVSSLCWCRTVVVASCCFFFVFCPANPFNPPPAWLGLNVFCLRRSFSIMRHWVAVVLSLGCLHKSFQAWQLVVHFHVIMLYMFLN